MIQHPEETKQEKLDKAMVAILEAIKKLNPGDNAAIVCPICGGELIVYKPFSKKLAAKCKTENCIRIVE